MMNMCKTHKQHFPLSSQKNTERGQAVIDSISRNTFYI